MPVAAPTRPRSVLGPIQLHNWPILLCVETDYVRIPEAHSRFPGSHPAIPPYALLRPLNAATETPTSLLAEPAGLAELTAPRADGAAASSVRRQPCERQRIWRPCRTNIATCHVADNAPRRDASPGVHDAGVPLRSTH